ncbi:MAG: cytochrome-c peroxidase [Cytophagales bacterium]|nr:MAG: cytochrome-c peroxidase [Cytophagales bacterium]
MQLKKLIGFVLLGIGFYACQENNLPKPTQPTSTPFSLQLPAHFGKKFTIPPDNALTEEGIALGRMLFYDVRLSRNNSTSCASCHEQKRAFSDGLAFSVGFRGKTTSRSAMALVNLLWVDKFFWDGRANSLEEQALHPIVDSIEMGMTLKDLEQKLQQIPEYPPLFLKAFGAENITAENIAKAIAQFERTLISSNSKYDKIVRNEIQPTAQELRAIQLFFTHPLPEANLRGANCGDCHGSHLITLNTFHDNGLDLNPTDIGLANVTKQPFDLGKRRAPTLRNIALTAPYMHDGRFKTLREVLDHYNEHIQLSPNIDPLILNASNEPNGKTLQLTEQEKEDILLFLQMLTDEEFINNPAFANPFQK